MPDPERLNVDGTSFPLVRVGNGVPVLFVHGAWADHRIWCGFWKPMSRKTKFMAITQRHFGLMEWADDKPFSRQVHTDDLIAVLAKLDEPVHLFGWSYAGGVLLRTAAIKPEQVLSLTIFEPSFECEDLSEPGPLLRAREDAWKRLEPAYHMAEGGNLRAAMHIGLEAVYNMKEGGFSDLHTDFQKVHLDNCHTMLPDLRAEPAKPLMSEEFNRIRCPVLVLYGENSLDQYKLMAQETSNSIENAKLTKVPGVSHGGPVQRPDLIAKAALDFIISQTH
ncbi:alpha/beta fold hydrolase [Roseovarius litorisediminis]|nr:alpha/beta hydrolase [Roseovarius litorisediminis]